jgi:hypothetical protein
MATNKELRSKMYQDPDSARGQQLGDAPAFRALPINRTVRSAMQLVQKEDFEAIYALD